MEKIVIIKRKIIFDNEFCNCGESFCSHFDFWDSDKCTLFNEIIYEDRSYYNEFKVKRCHSCLYANVVDID